MIFILTVTLLSFIHADLDFDEEALDLGEATSIEKLEVITLKKPDVCEKQAQVGYKLTVCYLIVNSELKIINKYFKRR
jgi:hypothetical protein